MRLASLLSLVPGFLAVYAQDLNIAAVEQAFNNANVSILLLLLHIPQFWFQVQFRYQEIWGLTLNQPSFLRSSSHKCQPFLSLFTQAFNCRAKVSHLHNRDLGLTFQTPETVGPPIFSLVDPKDPLGNAGKGPFVVAAVDPDAPTPTDTSHAQVRHFLGGDFFARNLPIHGLGINPLLSNTSAAISDWRQPTPTGGNHRWALPHPVSYGEGGLLAMNFTRYVFLAFNQPNGFDQQASKFVNASTPIQNWDVATFMQEIGLGDPIAGTFMMVANPDNPWMKAKPMIWYDYRSCEKE